MKNQDGKNNAMWKGGVSQEYCVKIAYEKYPNECAICRTKSLLDVHHKDVNNKNNKIDNLIILCKKCHMGVHKQIRGWSLRYPKCICCGTIERKHNAKGYCTKCYDKTFVDKNDYYRKNKEKVRQKDRDKYKNNPEYRKKLLSNQRERNKTPHRKEYLKNYHKAHSNEFRGCQGK